MASLQHKEKKGQRKSGLTNPADNPCQNASLGAWGDPGDAAAPNRNAGQKENRSQPEQVHWDQTVCSRAPIQSLSSPGRCTGPAWALEVAFHLHGVMGETSSPSCICLQHLIHLESSCWDKDKLTRCLPTSSGKCLASSDPCPAIAR